MFWELLHLLVGAVDAPKMGAWLCFWESNPKWTIGPFILIRMLAKDELLASLQKCVEELESVKSKEMKKALVQLRELLAKFQQMDGESWQ